MQNDEIKVTRMAWRAGLLLVRDGSGFLLLDRDQARASAVRLPGGPVQGLGFIAYWLQNEDPGRRHKAA